MNDYKQPTPYDLALRRNAGQPCKAPGCGEPRLGLNSHCNAHHASFRRLGHHNARSVKVSRYSGYRKEVFQVFDANPYHAGLLAAHAFINQWMLECSVLPDSTKAASEIALLVRHGVSTREVLIEVCAFWCFLQCEPRALPDTRSEDFAISKAVLKLAPRPRRYTPEATKKGTQGYEIRPKFAALDSIGALLRAALSFFLVNIAEAVANRDTRKQETLQALRAPLVSPSAVYVAEVGAAAAKAVARAKVPQLLKGRTLKPITS